MPPIRLRRVSEQLPSAEVDSSGRQQKHPCAGLIENSRPGAKRDISLAQAGADSRADCGDARTDVPDYRHTGARTRDGRERSGRRARVLAT